MLVLVHIFHLLGGGLFFSFIFAFYYDAVVCVHYITRFHFKLAYKNGAQAQLNCTVNISRWYQKRYKNMTFFMSILSLSQFFFHLSHKYTHPCSVMWCDCQCWHVYLKLSKAKNKRQIKITHCTGVQMSGKKKEEIFSYQILLSHILFANCFIFRSLHWFCQLQVWFCRCYFCDDFFSALLSPREDREWAIASHQNVVSVHVVSS